MSHSKYKLLRTTANLNDDVDWAGTQVAPVDALLAILAHPTGEVDKPFKVLVVVEWLDVLGDVVVGAGEYTAAGILVVDRALTANEIVVTSKTINNIGSRPLVITDLNAGDKFTVRLTDITAPGASTHLRVLYQESVQ